jgi:alpha-tubulin suppressor-like RCC1 family protein
MTELSSSYAFKWIHHILLVKKISSSITIIACIFLLIVGCAKDKKEKRMLDIRSRYVPAGGNHHSIAIMSPDTIKAWGYNRFGQLGDNRIVDSEASPVTIHNLTDIYEVACGSFHSIALMKNGEVMAWGHNTYGQLGLGEKGEAVSVPQKVPGIKDIVDVDAGGNRCAAVDKYGNVFTWGLGFPGDGTRDNVIAPTQLHGIEHIKHVSVGGDAFTLLLLEDGRVMAWGRNYYGTLGIGTSGDNTEKFEPVLIPGLENVVQISAGITSSLALLADSTVVAWGFGGHGNLGHGSKENSYVPVKVKNIRNVVQVSAGSTCLALLDDGRVMAWGKFPGNGSQHGSDVPVVVPDIDDAVAIATGMSHCLVKLRDGTILSWGWNLYGQCGEGERDYIYSPVRIEGW